MDSEKELKAILADEPLLAYAHDSWAIHARASLHLASTASRLADFIASCVSFPVLLQDDWDLDVLGPLHVIALFGFPIRLAGPDNLQALNTGSRASGATPLGSLSTHPIIQGGHR